MRDIPLFGRNEGQTAISPIILGYLAAVLMFELPMSDARTDEANLVQRSTT